MLLQMVLVLEGFSALCAFELTVSSRLVEQLVLREKSRKSRSGRDSHGHSGGGRGGKSSLNNHNWLA